MQGMQPCRYRLDGVCVQQSAKGLLAMCLDRKVVRNSNVLVDQEDSNVLSLSCKPLKCFLDSCIIRLAVNDKEILLRIWRRRDMLTLRKYASFGGRRKVDENILTPIPANNNPVTESCNVN
ncbi:hypothetical protein ACMFMF_004835 [Clarireedia jacksonii]